MEKAISPQISHIWESLLDQDQLMIRASRWHHTHDYAIRGIFFCNEPAEEIEAIYATIPDFKDQLKSLADKISIPEMEYTISLTDEESAILKSLLDIKGDIDDNELKLVMWYIRKTYPSVKTVSDGSACITALNSMFTKRCVKLDGDDMVTVLSLDTIDVNDHMTVESCEINPFGFWQWMKMK